MHFSHGILQMYQIWKEGYTWKTGHHWLFKMIWKMSFLSWHVGPAQVCSKWQFIATCAVDVLLVEKQAKCKIHPCANQKPDTYVYIYTYIFISYPTTTQNLFMAGKCMLYNSLLFFRGPSHVASKKPWERKQAAWKRSKNRITVATSSDVNDC